MTTGTLERLRAQAAHATAIRMAQPRNDNADYAKRASKTWCKRYKATAPHLAVERGQADILEWCAHLETWRNR